MIEDTWPWIQLPWFLSRLHVSLQLITKMLYPFHLASRRYSWAKMACYHSLAWTHVCRGLQEKGAELAEFFIFLWGNTESNGHARLDISQRLRAFSEGQWSLFSHCNKQSRVDCKLPHLDPWKTRLVEIPSGHCFKREKSLILVCMTIAHISVPGTH